MKSHFNRRIRIISGQWRNRKLSVFCSSTLRPTTNYMRETLFNWLAPFVVGARCLDCFAGSGALGIEALSRYASNVILLEVDHNTVQQLKKNLLILKATNAKVIKTNTLNFLKQSGIPYDIIFVDPPFYRNFLRKTLLLLEQNKWLADNAFIYVESEIENSSPLMFSHWGLYREKIKQQIAYRLYYRNIHIKIFK